MPTVNLEWQPSPPPDADQWERVIRDAYTESARELFVRLEQRDGGWRVDEARDTPIVRTAKMAIGVAREDPAPRGEDWRDRIVSALRDEGKPVVE